MSPRQKRPKDQARPADDHASRVRAAFPPCKNLSCFISSLFPVSRCRRVGAMAAFLFSVVAIQHGEANTPYLRAVGPIELRFQKRVAYIPPKKVPSSAGGEPMPPETVVAVAGAPPIVPAPIAVDKDPPTEKPKEKPADPPVQPEVKPIVPDTFAPRLVPEEVLPFFIIPESRGEKSISTATFKQK